MTTHTHNCTAVGCQKQIPLNMLMCGAHWKLVPSPIQRELLQAWYARKRRPSDQVRVQLHEDLKAQAVAAVEAKQNKRIATKQAQEGDLFANSPTWGKCGVFTP